MHEYICCFCGKKFRGWGNNPKPVVKDEGALCCDTCDLIYVVSARLKAMHKAEEKTTKEKKNGSKSRKAVRGPDKTGV